MEHINQFCNTEIIRYIGITALMTVFIAVSLWLAFKVVKHRRDLEIPLGLGAIATGLASLSMTTFIIPEQYMVSIGFSALTTIVFFIVYVGVTLTRSRKSHAKAVYQDI